MEITGHERINYTRDALALGISYFINDEYTLYVEPRWAWHLGNESRQDNWAIVGGMQYQGPFDMWNDSMAFYGGTHIRMFQEDNWTPGISAQCGYVIMRYKRSTSFRLAMEGYYGRALLGEFALDYDEAYLTINFMYDFY